MSNPALNIEVNALVNGLGDILDFQEKLQATGAELFRLTVPSTEAADSLAGVIEAANDSSGDLRDLTGATRSVADELQRLSPRAEGAVQSVAGLSDTVSDLESSSAALSENLSEASGEVSDFGQASAKGMAEAERAVSDFGDTAAQVGEVDEALGGVIDTIEELGEGAGSADDLSSSLDDLGEAASDTAGAAEDLAGAVSDAGADTEDLAGSIDTISETSDTATGALDDLTEATASASEEIKDLAPRADNTETEVSDLTGTVENLTEASDTLSGSLGNTSGNLDEFGNNATRNIDDVAGAADNLGGTSDNVDDLTGSLDEAAVAAAEAARAAEELARAAAEADAEIDDTTDSTSTLGGSLSDFARSAAPEASQRITDLSANLDEVRERAGTSEGRIQLLGMGLGKLAGLAGLAAGALIGIIGAINLKDAVEYAARLESLGTVVKAVGNNAGYTTEELADYEQELRTIGISAISSREAITQMASAGLELGDVTGSGSSQIADMARAAQNLSVVAGTTASEALENLIINIKQLDTEGLRNMGITLDQTAASAAYAKELGKSVGALSNAEKQQAAMNYVLAESAALAGVYASSTESIESKLNALGGTQKKLKEQIGNLLIPAYRSLINATSDFINETNESIATNLNAEAATASLTKAIGLGTKIMFSGFSLVVDIVMGLADDIFSIVDSVTEVASSVYGSFESIISIFGVANEGITTMEVGFKVLAFTAAAIADGFKMIEIAVRSVVVLASDGIALMLRGLAAIASVTSEEVATSIRGVADEFTKVADENNAASKAILQGFADGNSSVQKFAKNLAGVKEDLTDIGTGNSFEELSNEIIKLTGAQEDLTSVELQKYLNSIRERVDELTASTALTVEQQAQLEIKLVGISKNIATAYAEAFDSVGTSLAELNSGVSEGLSEVAGGLATLAGNAQTTGEVFNQAFNFSVQQANNISELSLLTDSIGEFGKKILEEGNQGKESLALLGEATLIARSRFEELFDSQLDAARTQKDFANLSEEVEKFGRTMIEAGLMTEQELELKLQEVAETAKEVATNLREVGDIAAFDKLGVDLEEIRTGFSAAFNEILDGFDELAVSSTVSSDTMGKAFVDVFDGVDNIKQLQAIKEKLNEAAEAGTITGDDLAKAGEAAADKFKELYKASLEAANTSEDFTKLREEITQAGESGVLSAEEVAAAFKEVENKVNGASNSVLAMAEQARELSQANLSISNAQTAVLRSQIDATKADIEYQSALTTHRKEGTAQSKLDLEVRKNELILARERVELAQAKQLVEEANYDMLIAKQQALNAEKRLELDINNAVLIAAAEGATREAEAKALVVSQVQSAYSKQEMVVNATERAALKAQALAENMRQTATNAGAAKSQVEGIATASAQVEAKANASSVALKSWSMAGIQNEMGKHIKDMETAARVGKEIYDAANEQQKRFVFATGVYFTNYGFANKLMSDRIEMLNRQEEKEARIADNRAAEAARVSQRAAEEQKAADLKQQALDALATSQQQYVDKLSAETDKVLGYATRVTEQAQYLADTGGNISEAFSRAAKEGLSEADQQIQRMKQGAQDLVKNALDAGTAFLQSTASLDAQLLGMQGKEAELLEANQKARRATLETEYELLKVKLEIARVTAVQAGVDSSALTEMLNKANAAYARTQETLKQIEAIETTKQAEKKSADIQNAQAKQQQATDAYLKQQAATANKGLRVDTPESTSPPVNHVITIKRDGMSDTEVLADSGNVDNLLKTLQDLKGRSA